MAPIYSMTGFGAASCERGGLQARVEIRAVNHRGLKLSVRSRPGLGAAEQSLRDIIGRCLRRGAVEVNVSLVRPVDEAHPPVRENTARGMVLALRRLGERMGLDTDMGIRHLILVPGLFDEGANEPVQDQEWTLVAEAAEAALVQVQTMREAEGSATSRRLAELLEPIARFAREARAIAPRVVERQRERLRARIAEVCPGGSRPVDEQSLEREICLLAERMDVNEELDRLASHLVQVRTMLGRGGEIGKRLEFLTQEILRELNTCASKASDTEIITRAVDAKVAVEQIREQAANIE